MATAVLIMDGHCAFCKRQAARLKRLSGDRMTVESFREPGVIARYPGLTTEACEKAMQLVRENGQRSSGAQAAADVLRLNPWLAWIGWIYYLPGMQGISEAVYRWVARNRYRFGGCTEGGACQIHPPHP